MLEARSSRRLSLPPRRIGGLVGLLLGAVLGAFIPSIAPWPVDRSQDSAPVFVLVGALAAGASGWLVGSMALRRPFTTGACHALFTYVLGVLLFPPVALAVAMPGSGRPNGSPLDDALGYYVLTPFAVIIDLPVLVLVILGVGAWLLLQRRLVPTMGRSGPEGEERPTDLWAWTTDESWDGTIASLAVTVAILTVGLGAVGLWLISSIKVNM